MADVHLFDPGPPVEPPRPLSDTRRRTIRRAAMLARGVHPTTHLRLRDPVGEHRCADCAHLYGNFLSRTYWKCDTVARTGGPATDVRLRWPACTRWEAA